MHSWQEVLFRLFFAGGATTVLALIILWVFQPLEKRITQKFK